ncbi:MAG: hypothetical protein GEU83_19800 [Pseudonocardiaceae bacterium]|nr:hypothetical protein [Pseudonocardiaceae bacterium]
MFRVTNDLTTPAKTLFARYAERMMVENELDAYIGGFHLDALTSGVPLNVDLDTTLTVVAGNLYRLVQRGRICGGGVPVRGFRRGERRMTP